MFASAHPKQAPAALYKALKGVSARRLLARYPHLRRRYWRGHLWNPSTFVETVGHISENTVGRYIEAQKS